MSIVRAKKKINKTHTHSDFFCFSDEFFDFIYRRIEWEFEVAAFVVIDAGDSRFRDREGSEDEVEEGVGVGRRDIVCGE